MANDKKAKDVAEMENRQTKIEIMTDRQRKRERTEQKLRVTSIYSNARVKTDSERDINKSWQNT
jgi:hypothetical protein